MTEKSLFVGRKEELSKFIEFVKDHHGQAALVAGPPGTGKTWLVNEMAERASSIPTITCGYVRYEVTKTDSVNSILALMIDHAFEAADTTEGYFDPTDLRKKQWKALLDVINIGDLAASLRRDPLKNTRDQFIEQMKLISGKMESNQRAIFIIDPEKYMQTDCDESWAIVVRDLPEKIKLVFAQRPDDVLIKSDTFDALDNVVRIPEKWLGELDRVAVDELIDLMADDIDIPKKEFKEALYRYKGHPYALQAALDLLVQGTPADELPSDPAKIAVKQWAVICEHKKKAIRLFKAYVILEVAVPDEVVEAVGKVDSDTILNLTADKYIDGLLRGEADGRRIYHAILSEYIIEQIPDTEKKEYHSRAVKIYRELLHRETKPNALAAVMLPWHVFGSEGEKAFVNTFINECTGALINLGLLDAAIAITVDALKNVANEPGEYAALCGNLGLIYRIRGDLDRAEDLHNKALAIYEKLGLQEGMANQFGNLGLIYQTRGDLARAEDLHNKALAIYEKLRLQEGMAREYSNLGVIYRIHGELDSAENMHLKSLKINEKLGRQEGMAIQFGNLGLIYQTRGEFDRAEDMHLISLGISEKLGLQEGMAIQFGNLGVIYQTRGEFNKAEVMQLKSLEINEKLGRQEGTACSYSNLGLIYHTLGDFDRAKDMLLKSLKINEKLGLQGSMAIDYLNLGVLYRDRGQKDKAREYLEKALKLFERIGMQRESTLVRKGIDELDE